MWYYYLACLYPSYHLTPPTLSPAPLSHLTIRDESNIACSTNPSLIFDLCYVRAHSQHCSGLVPLYPIDLWSLIPHTCLSSSHHSHLSLFPSLSNDDRLFAFSSLLRDLPDTDTETPPLSLFRSSTCVYRLIVHPPAITVALSPVLIDRYVAPLMDYGIRSLPIETESSCCLFLPLTVRGYSSLREERLERDLVWIPPGISLPSSSRYSTECLHKPSGLVPVEEALIAWSWDKNIPCTIIVYPIERMLSRSVYPLQPSISALPYTLTHSPPITTVLLRRPSTYSSQLLICPPHPTTRLPHFILCLVWKLVMFAIIKK